MMDSQENISVGVLIWCNDDEEITPETNLSLSKQGIQLKVFSNKPSPFNDITYKYKNDAIGACAQLFKTVFVMFPDTVLEEDCLERHYNEMEKHPYASVIYSDYFVEKDNIKWVQHVRSFVCGINNIPPIALISSQAIMSVGSLDMNAYPLEILDLYHKITHNRAGYHIAEPLFTMIVNENRFSTQQIAQAQQYLKSKNESNSN